MFSLFYLWNFFRVSCVKPHTKQTFPKNCVGELMFPFPPSPFPTGESVSKSLPVAKQLVDVIVDEEKQTN